MNAALKELVSAWRSMPLSKPPFVLSGDEAIEENGLCHFVASYSEHLDPIAIVSSGRVGRYYFQPFANMASLLNHSIQHGGYTQKALPSGWAAGDLRRSASEDDCDADGVAVS